MSILTQPEACLKSSFDIFKIDSWEWAANHINDWSNWQFKFTYSISDINKTASALRICRWRIHREALLWGRRSLGVVTIRNSSYLASFFSARWMYHHNQPEQRKRRKIHLSCNQSVWNIGSNFWSNFDRWSSLLSVILVRRYFLFRLHTVWCL